VTADALLHVVLHVSALTARGVQVLAPGSDLAFWLPRNGVTWQPAPAVGAVSMVAIPHWLAAKHQQLIQLRNDVASPPCVGQHANTRKENQMANSRDNSGALFRVADDEKKTDKWPDYKGDILLEGVKWWVSGWVRTSEKTGKKYLSLALRKAEEQPAKPKPPAREWQRPAADDPDSIPF
jgi:hypothetical protein